MSDAIAWTVNALMGKIVVLPESVADLPHRVHKKK